MAETPKEIAREVLPVNIEDELKQSYMEYAMSVIVSRALPMLATALNPSIAAFYTPCTTWAYSKTRPIKNPPALWVM